MKKILTFAKYKTNESMDVNEVMKYDSIFDDYYSKFAALEKQFNECSLDDLKNGHQLDVIYTKGCELEDDFNLTAYKPFFNAYSELPDSESTIECVNLSHKADEVETSIDKFMTDLGQLKSAFEMMGDLHRKKSYFKETLV